MNAERCGSGAQGRRIDKYLAPLVREKVPDAVVPVGALQALGHGHRYVNVYMYMFWPYQPSHSDTSKAFDAPQGRWAQDRAE